MGAPAFDPEFIHPSVVVEIHDQQIALYKGRPGVFDQGLLESAVSHPETLFSYNSSATIFDLAAAYAFRIAKNHPFHDGNKRTGAACAVVFLEANGYSVQKSFTDEMIAVAAGEMREEQLSSVLRSISRRRALPALLDFLRRWSPC